MDMESYRQKHSLSYARLAAKLGLDKPGFDMPATHVRRIAIGKMWPRAFVLDQIVEASGGEITILDMHKRYSAAHPAPVKEQEEQAAA